MPGDPISPLRGQRGICPRTETWGDAASSPHWGFHWQWGFLPAPADSPWEPQKQDSVALLEAYPHLPGATKLPRQPAWWWERCNLDHGHSNLGLGVSQPSEHTGRNPAKPNSLNNVIVQPIIMPLNVNFHST